MTIEILRDTPPPASADPRLHAFYAYWRGHCGAHPYPARADLDPPLEIPALLPHVSLVVVRATAPHFVYSVIGTKLVDLLKRDPTGNPVGTGVKPIELDSVLARYRRVADEGVVLYHRDRTQELANDFTGVDRLMLPLGPHGGPVDMILSIVVPLRGA